MSCQSFSSLSDLLQLVIKLYDKNPTVTRPELEKDFAITISTFLTKIPIELQEKARELNFSWWTRFEDDNEDAFDIFAASKIDLGPSCERTDEDAERST